MWKYIAASFFFMIGFLELILALNRRIREAVMKNSPLRSKRAEPLILFLVGLSAIAMGLWILFNHLFW